MALPNTIIVGVQKGGTSSFYDWLAQHPEVYGPMSGKDFHFFSREEYFEKGLPFLESRYQEHQGEPVILHAGVNYIISDTALQRLQAYNPKLRLLLVLRNPIRRAFSAHQFVTQLGREDLSFAEAVEKEQKGIPVNGRKKIYLQQGLYAQQLDNLLKYFPKEQIEIIYFEEMMQDKDAAMQQVFSWLNLQTTFQAQYRRINTTGKPKFREINKWLYSDSTLKKKLLHNPVTNALLSRDLRFKIRRLIREKNVQKIEKTEKPFLTKAQYDQLYPFFKEDIQRLSEVLDKDLNSIWKY